MNTLGAIEALADVPGPVALAIGVFDGVHLGHQEVIRSAQEHARQHSGTAVVMTFDPHPMSVLAPGSNPPRLCSLAHQKRILIDLGVSHLLVCPFTREFSEVEAGAFVDRLISAASPLGCVSVGYGWRFGRGGEGNVSLLMERGQQDGFAVYGVPVISLDGETISSTRIRKAVSEGRFADVQRLLGRPYTVLGQVMRGKQLGRTIGFPTANIETQDGLVPPNGVYAVQAHADGRWRDGVANLGTRPTVADGDPELRLEVHLFDFEGDLYGTDMDVCFVEKLREEKAFGGLDALKAQIVRDAEAAKQVLTQKRLFV